MGDYKRMPTTNVGKYGGSFEEEPGDSGLEGRAVGEPEVSDLDLSPQPISISATVEATWYVDLPD